MIKGSVLSTKIRASEYVGGETHTHTKPGQTKWKIIQSPIRIIRMLETYKQK